jgi:hypothetical protein
MKKILYKIYNWNYLPFVVLTFLIFIIHFRLSANTSDDVVFIQLIHEKGLKQFLIDHYNYTNSRVIVHAFVVIFVSRNIWIWRILDSLVIFLLALSISKVFIKKNIRQINWIIMLLFLTFPFNIFSSAGFVATTLNYIWPLAFCVFALIPIRKIYDNKKIWWFEYILYFTAAIYAVNVEQTMLILLVVYIIFTVYFIYKGKYNFFLFLQILLCIAGLIVFLICPATKLRFASETGAWFPDYGMLTMTDKLSISFTSTVSYMITSMNLTISIALGTLCFYIYKKYNIILYTVISFIPFVTALYFGVFSNISGVLTPDITTLLTHKTYGTMFFPPVTVENMDNIASYLPVFISICIIGMLFISLYLAFENTTEFIVSFLVLGAGFGTRFMMGFSPTVYASSARTFTILIFCLITVSALIFSKFISLSYDSAIKKYTVILVSIALICFLNNISIVYVITG